MFLNSLTFEWRYYLRQPSFYVTMLAFFLLPFLATTTDNVRIGGGILLSLMNQRQGSTLKSETGSTICWLAWVKRKSSYFLPILLTTCQSFARKWRC